MLAVTKAARHFGVCTLTIRNWIHAGKLQAIKPNAHWRIPVSEIERLSKPKVEEEAGTKN